MKKLNLILALAITVTSNVSMAQIFRTVTADGQVVYTDNADSAYKYNNDVSKMAILDNIQSPSETQKTNTAEGQASSELGQNTVTMSPNNTFQPTEIGFYDLSIITPDTKMVYRRPNDIRVQVETKPTLQAGDRFVYRINGKHIATTQENTYDISSLNYMPEKYTLTVQIENGKGKIIAEKSQEFHLLTNNFAIRQKRKAQAEAKAKKEAYDKLPWYKKIGYNINISVK